jgi:hypothetical protein
MAEWYEDYLNSPHWQKTRLTRLLKADINDEWNLIRCERSECGIYVPLAALQVHHLTYKRLGRERMEDLQVLCCSCHHVVHGGQPQLWWEHAKRTNQTALFMPAINGTRSLKRIGDVMRECLAYCDIRTLDYPLPVATP